MALLKVIVLLLAMTGHSSATWCICNGMGDSVLQRTLDYACGAGADCNPIKQNGPCFQPNTVKAHCSYAVNSYFQRKGQSQGSCDFSGTASISSSDPSTSGCIYPSSASGSGGGTGTTPSTTMPSTGKPSMGTPSTGTTATNMPSTTTPYSGTPSTGVLGGIGNGVGPSGAGINTDDSNSGFRIVNSKPLSYISYCLVFFTAFVISMRA